MGLEIRNAKGIESIFADSTIGENTLRLHVSELGAGEQSHPPHQHGGLEALYVLGGTATFQIAEETAHLTRNQAVVFDPARPHTLRNPGSAPLSYLVIRTECDTEPLQKRR